MLTSEPNNRVNELLAHSSILGDSEGVTKALRKGADPNLLYFNGVVPGRNTPLQLACIHDEALAALTLIRLGAELLIKNMFHRDTALHSAFKHKAWGCACVLLECAISEGCWNELVKTRNKDGETALDIAIAEQEGLGIYILFQYAARVNHDSPALAGELALARQLQAVIENPGQTALDLSLSYYAMVGDGQRARLVLRQDANPNRRCMAFNGHSTPLLNACSHGHAHVVKLLLEYDADPRLTNGFDETALHVACREQHFSCAKLLLESNHGLELLEMRDIDQCTALHSAAELPDAQLVDLLTVEYSANILAIGCHGNLAVHLATIAGQMYSALLLIGDDVDVLNTNFKETPLFQAARHGHVALACQLLNLGASPSYADYRGLTPAHVAALADDVEMLELLRRYGADLSIRDKVGKTAFGVALEAGCAQAARFLAQTTPLFYESDCPVHGAAHNSLRRTEWNGVVHCQLRYCTVHVYDEAHWWLVITND
eukprot:m.45998 g.45998  ORF g.45998 m.45998 type:complete len:489 (-) comp13112_c0_seq1:247-1713(-)